MLLADQVRDMQPGDTVAVAHRTSSRDQQAWTRFNSDVNARVSRLRQSTGFDLVVESGDIVLPEHVARVVLVTRLS